MKPLATIVLLTATTSLASAQGSRDDYERARTFRQRMANKVFRTNVRPQWIEGQAKLWYRVQTGVETSEFNFVDATTGERRSAFDHGRLAKALSEAASQDVAADRLPFRTIRFDDGLMSIRFNAFDKSWRCDLESYAIEELSPTDVNETTVRVLRRPRRSRNGGAETHVRFINRTDGPVKLFWINSSGGRQPYESIAAGKQHRQHTFARHVWLVTDADGKPLAVFEATEDEGVAIIDGKQQVESAEVAGPPRRRPDGTSPDGRWRALIKEHNVYLRDLKSDEERQLSKNGREDDRYLPRFAWSPDSSRLVVLQERAGDDRQVSFVESSPDDQLQPKLHTFTYTKPGDKLPVARPRLFDVDGRQQIPVADDLFPNAWSINEVRWQPDSRRFTFLYNQRGHQLLRIVVVDGDTGEAAALVDETSDTFIDYAYKRFTHYLDETHELIWMSERDGWNHLYLYDSRTGDVKNQITQGSWVVREVERVDDEGRRIWFYASGVYPEQDPYYRHLCRVNFDGSGFVVLTAGNGTHDVRRSPDGKYLVDTYSRVDLPPVTELRRAEDGSLVCELERGDWSQLLATGWRAPERFVAKGRNGETDIHGVIYRPTNFDPQKKYPVIELIYAGPHGSFVPKDFGVARNAHANTELGFILVRIDGMGTSNRSKAFHDVCWRNLGDSGFPDRILWMKAAAKEYPYMDLTRVGIYGGSAGGQSALRALLAHGDFYKAAVADCGCHDNRMDKVWWNELWMGWPIGPHYAEQSNVTNAHKLTGKLLLTVGEVDRNVDPASTMQVVNALIKADKDFDLIVFPGGGHGVGESPYGRRRRRDFFVRQLLGVEPRWKP